MTFVVLDPHERQQVVLKAAQDAAASVGGVPADDPELVQTVANLTEYPTAVCGSFANAFLDLPDAVLITAMREHQKYFAVYDHEGSLMPIFVAINNTKTRDESVVCRGHERVLRARLSDADFFLKEDRKRPLLERLEDLKQVIYQAQLGTSYAKVMRVEALAAHISDQVIPEQVDGAKLAARLAKCDLVTHMVIEFPSLQGAVGKAYAELEGYDEEICSGIYDHYLPLKAGVRFRKLKSGLLWEWRTVWTPSPDVLLWVSNPRERPTRLPFEDTHWPLSGLLKIGAGIFPLSRLWKKPCRFWRKTSPLISMIPLGG